MTSSTDEKCKSGYSWQSHRELSLHSVFVILQITSVPFSKLFWFWHPTCGSPTLGMSSFPLLAFTEPGYNHLPYRHEGWVHTKSATAIKKKKKRSVSHSFSDRTCRGLPHSQRWLSSPTCPPPEAEAQLSGRWSLRHSAAANHVIHHTS